MAAYYEFAYYKLNKNYDVLKIVVLKIEEYGISYSFAILEWIQYSERKIKLSNANRNWYVEDVCSGIFTILQVFYEHLTMNQYEISKHKGSDKTRFIEVTLNF